MKAGAIRDSLSPFLFIYRNTLHSTTGLSPAKLLLGRHLWSPSDLLKPDLASRVSEKQVHQKTKHDKQAQEWEIRLGDAVFAKNFGCGQTWSPAVVTAQMGPVSFEVEVLSSGLSWRRHQDQLCYSIMKPLILWNQQWEWYPSRSSRAVVRWNQ